MESCEKLHPPWFSINIKRLYSRKLFLIKCKNRSLAVCRSGPIRCVLTQSWQHKEWTSQKIHHEVRLCSAAKKPQGLQTSVSVWNVKFITIQYSENTAHQPVMASLWFHRMSYWKNKTSVVKLSPCPFIWYVTQYCFLKKNFKVNFDTGR